MPRVTTEVQVVIDQVGEVDGFRPLEVGALEGEVGQAQASQIFFSVPYQ